jgi:hypothetical protein
MLSVMPNMLPHPCKQILFASLSAADLSLTCWLLGHTDAEVYEANPVASLCLAHCGWVGLTGFKAGLFLLVAALVVVIAHCRPRLAGRLLSFGCACLAVVLLYSASLYLVAVRSADGPEAWQAARTAAFRPPPPAGFIRPMPFGIMHHPGHPPLPHPIKNPDSRLSFHLPLAGSESMITTTDNPPPSN